MNGLSTSPGMVERYRFFRGIRRRVGATIGLLVGGFVWIVLYLVFLAGRFAWYVNLTVVFGSLVLVPALVVAIWVFWGTSLAHRFHHAFWDDEWF